MRNILLVMLALALTSCTEVQFASHVFKNPGGDGQPQTTSTTPTQGTFKVGKPYVVQGTTYYPKENYNLVETGIASWYGPGFHGGRTASGEDFNTNELTAAHRTLQLPSLVRVTNLENGRSVIVRVNDRGPFARSRVIDVSSRAADLLGFKGRGTAKVKLEVLPQESLRIAEMAKQGINTRGTELAMNNPGYAPAGEVLGVSQPVIAEPLAVNQPVVPMHVTREGVLMPDPVVVQMPVHPTSIYVQAGAFGVYDNAERMRQKLSSLGSVNIQQALVGGKQLYRVRVGPINDVASADAMLNRVVAQGQNKAIIVVD
ncbi:MAG: rare lipoprotein family protein [Micavibrio sp.]|nr:rare lipoprotein family protein [Micavibrio sp.]